MTIPLLDRERLVAELASYRACDAREHAMVAEFIAFVQANPNCFERALAIGHVTASAWVIDGSGSFALLTHHRKLGRWLQLGGHADGDADVRAVAQREVREESGLAEVRFFDRAIYDVDIHTIPARPDEPEHAHYDVRFAFVADRAAPLTVSAESHDLAWVPIADLDVAGVDESVRRLARKTPRLGASGRF